MTDADANGPLGLFTDRRRTAFVVSLLAYLALVAAVATTAVLPTAGTLATLRFGFVGLAVWGGLEYLRTR